MKKSQITNHKSQIKSFTLLEILVVIGIIAVLVGIGSVSYSTAQKKSRDAKRKSDLKAIQTGLEQYYSICSFVYPGSISSGIICLSPSTAIMPVVPKDPKGIDYSVVSIGTTGYNICVPTIDATHPLETETGASPYCVTNQQ